MNYFGVIHKVRSSEGGVVVQLKSYRLLLGEGAELLVNQVVTSWILKLNLSFKSSRFPYMTKESWQKLKYLERAFQMK